MEDDQVQRDKWTTQSGPLSGPWWACALLPSKVDGFAPLTPHVKLRKDSQPEGAELESACPLSQLHYA